MAEVRTDLALESGALEQGGQVEGVETRQEEAAGWPLTVVEVVTQAGAEALGKPRGTYLTLDLSGYRTAGTDAFPRAVEAVGACLDRLLPQKGREALVVGLGNRSVTPDAIGPRCADHVLVTRHLTHRDPEQFGGFFPVAALAAGVLGTTGVESGELVEAVSRSIRPDVILAVDALAARSVHRLCTTIQIADTGITPESPEPGHPGGARHRPGGAHGGGRGHPGPGVRRPAGAGAGGRAGDPQGCGHPGHRTGQGAGLRHQHLSPEGAFRVRHGLFPGLRVSTGNKHLCALKK